MLERTVRRGSRWMAGALWIGTFTGCTTLREENRLLREENARLKAQLHRTEVKSEPAAEPPGTSGPEPASPPTATNTTNPSRTGQTYVVRNRDVLSDIALKFYGDPTRWEEIYLANKDKIGKDPDRLEVGMVLVIPPR